MNVAKLRGMRYPDEYIVRMFFKERLAPKPGRVLELGCGSANNLMLFASYGWEAIGIDFDPTSLEDGLHNLAVNGLTADLIQHDLNVGLPELSGRFDVILAPSSLYYISRRAALKCMSQINSALAPSGLVYLRMRLPDDHRVGRGLPEGEMAWRLDCDYTGEKGALNVFWHEHELIDLLQQTLGASSADLNVMRIAYDNLQGGRIVRNSDIVLWGRKP